MTHEGQQDYQSLQNKIQGLSTDEMRHLCNLIAERNPALVQEILEEQERWSSEITEQHQAELPPNWCVCHSCQDMPATQERVCCANSPMNYLSFVLKMSEVVLHHGVLHVADTYRRAIFGIPLETDKNRCFRHSAYRQFTVWHYGRLGSRVRGVIPSCCVWRIRDRYPNPLGQYTGFLAQWRTVIE
ncbi:P2X purinoceptor 7-like [Protopterus annectens]|uniref:P2X purinoceptor 7-like n=1 Tax=Protopterus annectens TaxID=7888 RepID=UPI001CFA779F|nr:P2X purinoceptor 7-like [Protopterus annectens]